MMSRQSSMGSYGSGSSNSGSPAGSSPSIFKKSTPPVLARAAACSARWPGRLCRRSPGSTW
jgi:hypothetical protein